MLLRELFARHLAGVQQVVDVSPAEARLDQLLQPPASVHYTRHDVAAAEQLAFSPDTALVALLGPKAPAHSDPEAIAAVLRRLQPGARALLLLSWPVADLPYHRLLGPLVEAGCQVVEALPLDGGAPAAVPGGTDKPGPGGVHCALLVECVDKLTGIRAYLTDITEPDAPTTPAPAGDELRTMLRLANEYVLGDLVARPIRRRVAGLNRAHADATARIRELTESLQAVRRQLDQANHTILRLETSISLQVGRVVVDGLRRPGHAVVTVPRGLAAAWRMHRANRAMGITEGQRRVPIALPGRPKPLLMTAPSNLLVPRRLHREGLAGYETEAVACFLAALDAAGPGAVFDIGANVGIYAGLASAVSQRDVVAFEPAPALAAVAQQFGRDNALRFAIERLALSDADGSATLYLSDTSDTSNSLAAGFRKSSSQIDVPVERLDGYVQRTGKVPAVIKVDTESTEPAVLRGAVETIIRHRPWILCEVLARRVERGLTEVLRPLDYHWYHVTAEVPLRETDTIVGDPEHRHLMWLFAPERPSEAFWRALRDHAAALAGCTPHQGRFQRLRAVRNP